MLNIEKKSDLRKLTVKELRTINSDNGLEIIGAWKMKKDDLVEEIFDYICEAWDLEDDETTIKEPKKKGRKSSSSIPIVLMKENEIIGEFKSILQAAKFLEEKIGGKLYEGLKGLAKGTWTPKRGRLQGYRVIVRES